MKNHLFHSDVTNTHFLLEYFTNLVNSGEITVTDAMVLVAGHSTKIDNSNPTKRFRTSCVSLISTRATLMFLKGEIGHNLANAVIEDVKSKLTR